MASAIVYEALNAAIASAWSHTPIKLPNAVPANVPADGSAFLTVSYPFSRERQASVGAPGANRWRSEGGVRIELSIPVGDDPNADDAPWLARLDALRAALRGKLFGGVETFGASPAIMDGSSDRDAYFVMSFGVEYMADVIG